MTLNGTRPDLDAIIEIIPPQSRVLDLGCGDGELLVRLIREKQVTARGVELSEANVRACIARGLSVRQGNIEEGLADYPDGAFDYVILSQTLAYLDHPIPVVNEMLRVGRRAIISFENAGYWRTRWRALRGKGIGGDLCSGEVRARAITLPQFETFASACIQAKIESVRLFNGARPVRTFPNWQARIAIYVLSRGQD
ncbi:MAG: methionine biosynthesis protein MetW [Anaerolineae bacterium]|nr:methionine biosynthesis protein MetW [Anaerolineae bacterium]